MRQGRPNALSRLTPALALTGLSFALWAAWRGWDQHRDVRADGTTTGPYEAWQVIGLVLTLLAPVCWAAYRRRAADAVLGATAGLTVAAYLDWSDDPTGLYLVGVGLVMLGSLAGTVAVTRATAWVTRDAGRPGA